MVMMRISYTWAKALLATELFMEIYVHNQQDSLDIDQELVKEIAASALRLEDVACHELSITFVDEAEMGRIHDERFGDPSPTDCMSFPVDDEDEEYRVLGDVVVCPDVAITYAKEHNLEPYEETTLYMIHGLLHLMGYRDATDDERSEMRHAEEKHMAHLKKSGLILGRKTIGTE